MTIRGNFRQFFAGLLSILGLITLTLSILFGYCSRTLFKSDVFADRLALSLSDPRVAAFVAERAAEGLIARQRDLLTIKPVLIASLQSMAASDVFRGIVRRAALRAHQALMARGDSFLLNMKDLRAVLQSAISAHPELLQKIPARVSTVVLDSRQFRGGPQLVKLIRFGRSYRLAFLILLTSGLVSAIGAILVSANRRTLLLRMATAFVILGLALRLSVRFGGSFIAQLSQDLSNREALAGLWHIFFHPLMTWGLAMAMIGLVVITGVYSLFERISLKSVWNKLTCQPANTNYGLLRGSILTICGLLIVVAPGEALTIAASAGGLLIAFIGLREVFSIFIRALPVNEPRPERSSSRVQYALIAAITIAMIGGIVFYVSRPGMTVTDSHKIHTCNGYAALCDRPVNEVVFPATHNSMSAGDVSEWMFPNQEKGIRTQLNDGIRALLFDVHFGVSAANKTKTSFENEQKAIQKYEAALGKEGVEAALRIRDRITGHEEGEPAIYLCHGFCELGSIRLQDALLQIREFLVTNPAEVLILVVQNEGVTSADLEKAFQESDLTDFTYKGGTGPSWPTLRRLIASDQRLIVTTEHWNPGVAWIHSAFKVIQETPYSFKDPSMFSCKTNRGEATGSLFLMNHWIETVPAPRPSNAQIVNAYDFLLKRAEKCRQERSHLPNVIAVDFYRTGDLFGVVKTLNAVSD